MLGRFQRNFSLACQAVVFAAPPEKLKIQRAFTSLRRGSLALSLRSKVQGRRPLANLPESTS